MQQGSAIPPQVEQVVPEQTEPLMQTRPPQHAVPGIPQAMQVLVISQVMLAPPQVANSQQRCEVAPQASQVPITQLALPRQALPEQHGVDGSPHPRQVP